MCRVAKMCRPKSANANSNFFSSFPSLSRPGRKAAITESKIGKKRNRQNRIFANCENPKTQKQKNRNFRLRKLYLQLCKKRVAFDVGPESCRSLIAACSTILESKKTTAMCVSNEATTSTWLNSHGSEERTRRTQ